MPSIKLSSQLAIVLFKFKELTILKFIGFNQWILLTARVLYIWSNFQGFSLQTNNLPQQRQHFDKYSLQKSREVSQPGQVCEC